MGSPIKNQIYKNSFLHKDQKIDIEPNFHEPESSNG